MARTHPPIGMKTAEKGPGQHRRQSRADSGLTAMPRTPSRLVDRLECRQPPRPRQPRREPHMPPRRSRTQMTNDTKTATTTVIAVGRQTRGAHELSARAYKMRGSLVFPGFDQCSQVRWGHQPQRMARGLPAHVPRGRSGRRPFHHQEHAALPRRLRTNMTRASTSRQDQQLDRPALGLRRKLPRHVHPPRQAVGAAQLQTAAGGEPARVHPTLLQALH
jgi:hypothetical protein